MVAPVKTPVVPRVKPLRPVQIAAAREEFTKLKRHLNEIASWNLTSLDPIEFMFSSSMIQTITEKDGKTYLEILEKRG